MLYGINENFLKLANITLMIVIVIMTAALTVLSLRKPSVILYDDFSGQSSIGKYSQRDKHKLLMAFIFSYIELRYNFTYLIAKHNLNRSFRFTTKSYKKSCLEIANSSEGFEKIEKEKLSQAIHVIMIEPDQSNGVLIAKILARRTIKSALEEKKSETPESDLILIKLYLEFNSNHKDGNPYPYVVADSDMKVIKS